MLKLVQRPKTVGEVRELLAEVLAGLRNNTIRADNAYAVAKVAGRISESMNAEARVLAERMKLGEPPTPLGGMRIGDTTTTLLRDE